MSENSFLTLPACPQGSKYGHLHQSHDADRLLARFFGHLKRKIWAGEWKVEG
jgi:hypothetical protein